MGELGGFLLAGNSGVGCCYWAFDMTELRLMAGLFGGFTEDRARTARQIGELLFAFVSF